MKNVANRAMSSPVSTWPAVVAAPTAPLVSASRFSVSESRALWKALSIWVWDSPSGPVISQSWISPDALVDLCAQVLEAVAELVDDQPHQQPDPGDPADQHHRGGQRPRQAPLDQTRRERLQQRGEQQRDQHRHQHQLGAGDDLQQDPAGGGERDDPPGPRRGDLHAARDRVVAHRVPAAVRDHRPVHLAVPVGRPGLVVHLRVGGPGDPGAVGLRVVDRIGPVGAGVRPGRRLSARGVPDGLLTTVLLVAGQSRAPTRPAAAYAARAARIAP